MVILQPGNAAFPANASPSPKDLTLAPAAAAKVLSAVPAAPTAFHELLSELNPLQYLPVIGTLFRALTGETISQPALEAGSMVVSGLIAGPIGLAMNLGGLAIEKVTGLNPDKIEQNMLASIGIGQKNPADVVAVENLSVGAKTQDSAVTQSAIAWSPAQLAAYGVTASQAGENSDALNGLELARIRARHAIVQYASNAGNRNG